MGQTGGGILLAIGILVAGLSGLCSLSVLFGTGEFSGLGMWPAVLMFGGIPFAAGAGLVWWGWSAIRHARRGRKLNPDEISDVFE